MNEINPKPEYWVLSLSGGKDSTALGLEWLARHKADPVTYPLHEVVYGRYALRAGRYVGWPRLQLRLTT